MEFFQSSNRKGNAVLDTLVIVLILFLFGVSSLFSGFVLDVVDTDIQNTPELSNETKNVTGTLNSIHGSLFDNLLLMMFGLLIVGVLVSVFLLDTHPVFFFVNVVILILVFVVITILANAYDDIASDSTIASYSAGFPYTTWIITHFLEVGIVTAFIILIALFIKFKKQ